MRLFISFAALLFLFCAQPSDAFCFGRSRRGYRLRYTNDKWLRGYNTVRVATSDFHYLPSYLASTNVSYGKVQGNATLKIRWAKTKKCDPAAMSASGVFTLQAPPKTYKQNYGVFASHLHEGTCDDIDKRNNIVNGIGNHYQHIPACPTYSYGAYAPECPYPPGGHRWNRIPFELWPTFYHKKDNIFKVGSLGEQGKDLMPCPNPCIGTRCFACQARSVPWWPAPGTALSIVVHDTPPAVQGAGPVMLCADLTGRAVETDSCKNADVEGCTETSSKKSKFCLAESPYAKNGTSAAEFCTQIQ